MNEPHTTIAFKFGFHAGFIAAEHYVQKDMMPYRMALPNWVVKSPKGIEEFFEYYAKEAKFDSLVKGRSKKAKKEKIEFNRGTFEGFFIGLSLMRKFRVCTQGELERVITKMRQGND